ncbi:MAG: GIDE domain-containing protein, partial [Candidatus Sulfotelmatobacter sp.]
MTIATLLLRASNPGGFILWCLIGICGGIYLFVQGFRLLQRRRLILDTPASKIRSASIGMVELNGLAVGPYTMVAPITERPCYCYRTFVWEWKQSGKNKQWVKVAAECMHVPFFLDDNTGKVMVDPRGADLDLHRDFQQEFCDGFFTTKEEAPPNVRSFLSRHGIMTTNKIKVEESCIKPKNALFLLGTLDDNPGLELTPDPIHDAETTPLIVGNALSFSINTEMFRNALSPVTGGDNGFSGLSLSGGLQHDPAFDPIYDKAISTTRATHPSPDASTAKTADPAAVAAALQKAGITSPAAWAAAQVTPTGGATSTATDGFDPRPAVVLMKGKNNPTFLISWRSQRDLASSLGWKCTLMIWGGPALALLSLYLLLAIT